jgi:hypothetical protein
MMWWHNKNAGHGRGITLPELLVSIVIMGFVFVAALPLVRHLHMTWTSRTLGGTDILQHARVLADHITGRLSRALQVTAVSQPGEVQGYIEFEDADGAFRYELEGASVMFGAPNKLFQLATPVGELDFTCYDANDFSTPALLPETVRSVRTRILMPNPDPAGKDIELETWAWLRANYSAADANGTEVVLVPGSRFEFNSALGMEPAAVMAGQGRCLCVYRGNGDDGWAVLLEITADSWNISEAATLEFDPVTCHEPALAELGAGRYLCAYSGHGGAGLATVLSVNTTAPLITAGSSSEFDPVKGQTPALAPIDSSRSLCIYSGKNDDGWAAILEAGPVDSVSVATTLEFDNKRCLAPAVCALTDTEFLVAYEGNQNIGNACVLSVDAYTPSISKLSEFEFDTESASDPQLSYIDSTRSTLLYTGPTNRGYAAVLEAAAGTRWISRLSTAVFEQEKALTPAIAGISDGKYLCAYEGPSADAFARTIQVAGGTQAITACARCEYDPERGKVPELVRVDDTHYIVLYQGPGNDGWAAILELRSPVMP